MLDHEASGSNQIGQSKDRLTARNLIAPILIVDDDFANRLAFQEVLKDRCHNLIVASSGQEAIAAVEKAEFAVILLDVRMPGLNGYDTAAAIRRRPRSKNTPILFMTAFEASAQEISEAYGVGGTDFIRKPVDDVVLRKKVQVFVDVFLARIEAREWAKELSETSDRRLRLIFEQMPVNLCTVNRDLRITFADGIHVRSQGKGGAEIIGRRVTDFVADEERPKVEKAFRDALQGLSTSYETRYESWSYMAHVQPLFDRDKAIIGAICGSLDVTPQKDAERKASEQKTLLEAVCQAATDAVFVKDTSGRFLLVNQAGADLFGKTTNEVVGKTDPELLPESIARIYRESDRRVLETGQSIVTEEQTPLADGPHTLRLSKAPLRDPSGKIVGIVGVAHDVTDLIQTRERLLERNRIFEMVMASTNEVFWDWDARTNRCVRSGAVEQICEKIDSRAFIPLDEARDSFRELVHPDDRERVLHSFDAALGSAASTWSAEYRLQGKSGRVLHVLDRAVILRDEKGSAFRVVGACHDITPQKQGEELLAKHNRDLEERVTSRTRELRESQDQLRLAVEGAGMGTWALDIKTGGAIWSEQTEKLLGYEPGSTQASFEAWRKRIHPGDLDRVLSEIDRVRKGQTEYKVEYRILRAGTGEERWMSSRGRAVCDDAGAPVRLTGVIFDVTDQKRAEVAKALLAATVESSDDAIVTATLDGTITSWNQSAERLFGYRENQAVGKHISLIIPDELRSEEEGILKRLRLGERIEHFETRRRSKDGKMFDISLTVSPVRDAHGEIIGASKVARDITERKRAQEALKEALEESNAFTSNVAHELRTPLRSMSMMAQLLCEEYSLKIGDAEGRAQFDRLIHAAGRLDSMTQDLLSYSRLSRSQVPLSPVDPGTVLGEVLAGMQNDLTQRNATVELQGPFTLVQGNTQMLAHALGNLIYNAIKFVAQGTAPRVVVRSERRTGWLRLWVEDNGIGISPEGQGRLFQVFERLAPEYPGTGVGLAMVRKILDRMGGKVGVESQIGKGSKFWMDLPVAASAAKPSH